MAGADAFFEMGGQGYNVGRKPRPPQRDDGGWRRRVLDGMFHWHNDADVLLFPDSPAKAGLSLPRAARRVSASLSNFQQVPATFFCAYLPVVAPICGYLQFFTRAGLRVLRYLL